MKYLVIGSGGREDCIARRLMYDGSASAVFVAPGNGGTPSEQRVGLAVDDFSGITDFCKSKKIDMVVVGPEAPLARGIVDFISQKGIPVFGPTQRAAMLESSKLFAKHIMNKYSVPTAKYREFKDKKALLDFLEMPCTKYPLVIKLDGLAAGKGVGIPENREEALAFVNDSISDGTVFFTEEFAAGEEASVLGISDGKNIKCLIAAQDHKRIFDGDKGPNTGGMGAYAPAPVVTPALRDFIQTKIMEPVIEGMLNEGIPFKGVLYAGLMINNDGVSVLEFNVRFGDPETQAILPLLKGKLGDILWASYNGTIDAADIVFESKYALTVVMASQGYPKAYERGNPISGIDEAEKGGAMVFHAGTEYSSGKILTSGGRVLNVTATGSSLAEAQKKAYEAVGKISFEGAQFRRDIGYRAL